MGSMGELRHRIWDLWGTEGQNMRSMGETEAQHVGSMGKQAQNMGFMGS